jgi:two-component system, LytTR family, sensor histidine kinase AlgZ
MAHPVLTDRRRLGPYLLAWAPLATIASLVLAAAEPEQWLAAIALGLPLTLLLGFLCLAAWYPSLANPAPATTLPRLATLHLGGAAATTAAWLAAGWLWSRALAALPQLAAAPEVFLGHLPLLGVTGLFLYLLAVAASYVYLGYRSARDAERRALELQVTAREAELRALRAQLDPHFLFNALHSVSALCSRDPQGARRMTELLGDFLRSSLELVGQEEIRLGRELQLALNYLQIERVRFGERLKFVHQADEAAMASLVPPLLLQPLVENALKHGVAHLVEGGTIKIQARLRQATVYLVVENPCDPSRPAARGTELGLENVRRRLAASYGERALLTFDRRPDRFRVEVRLPARGHDGGHHAEGRDPAERPAEEEA